MYLICVSNVIRWKKVPTHELQKALYKVVSVKRDLNAISTLKEDKEKQVTKVQQLSTVLHLWTWFYTAYQYQSSTYDCLEYKVLPSYKVWTQTNEKMQK